MTGILYFTPTSFSEKHIDIYGMVKGEAIEFWNLQDIKTQLLNKDEVKITKLLPQQLHWLHTECEVCTCKGLLVHEKSINREMAITARSRTKNPTTTTILCKIKPYSHANVILSTPPPSQPIITHRNIA